MRPQAFSRLHHPVRRTTRMVLVLFLAAVGLLFAAPANAAPSDPTDPCDRPTPPTYCTPVGNPTGTLASISRPPSGLVVSGSASDPDAPGAVEVVVEVNSAYAGSLWASGAGGAFSGTVTPRAGSQVCVVAINRNRGEDVTLGCQYLDVRINPFGSLDEVSPGPAGLHIRGWAIDPDATAPADVHVYLDGVHVRSVNASGDRPDVGAAYPAYGSSHGYDLTLPAGRGRHTVCTYGINVGPGDANSQLGCATLTQGGAPAAPEVSLTGSPGVVWARVLDHSTDEDSFVLERSIADSGAWSAVHTFPPLNGPAYWAWDDRGITDGTRYCYRATARNIYGSATSATSCVTVPLPALPKPTSLSVTGITQTALTLNWTDNATTEDYYTINRSGTNTVVLPARAGTGQMTYTVTGLTAGTQHCFDIGPQQAGHASDPARVCATTQAAPPTQPPGIKTVQLWNCEPHQRAGSVWQFNHSVGGWSRLSGLPTSWTAYGCGNTVTGPAASVNLPNNQYVTLAVVIVDGTYCRTEDPTNTACLRWQAGPLRGDTTGTLQPAIVG